MAGINVIGSYSGIDRAAIDKLMEAESLPLVQMQNDKKVIEARQKSWRDLNARIDGLNKAIEKLSDLDTFSTMNATSSNADYVSFSVDNNAIEGSYRVEIEQLATSTNIIGKKVFADKEINDSLDIEGKFNIENSDGEKIEISVDKEDSLKDIAKKINELTHNTKDEEGNSIKGTGIKATVIDNRIVLEDTKTGVRDIKLIDTSLDDTGILNDLGLKGDEVEYTQGVTSKFKVNGIEVERDSNSVSDVIDGVTINLSKVHDDGDSTRVNVGVDIDEVKDAVEGFVNQYNATMLFLESKMEAGNPDVPGSRGDLAGDSSVMRLHRNLRQLTTSSINAGPSGIKNFSELGVGTIDRSGQLHFNPSKLEDAIKDDPNKVKEFFKAGETRKEDFTGRINREINAFISKDSGVIKLKNETLDKNLKDLDRRIDNFLDRLDRKEQHYIKVFTALDVAMMKAESELEWLSQQVSGMNGSNKK